MSKSRDIADSAATINFIDNLTSDAQTQLNTLDTAVDNISVTSGTLTKTFAQDEVATITLSSSITTPVVSVTKEVSQTGVTNNTWDVNSTSENYTRLNSAPATTLDFVGSENVDELSYSNKSFSGTSQSNNFSGLIISTDGTKMYGSDYGSTTIYQYSLSTAGDITTASYDSKSFNHGKVSVLGIALKSDGTKLFVLDFDTDALYQYTLSTAYDISTAGSATSFSVSSQAGSALGIYFKPDGTKFYITDNGTDSIYQYSMSTAWDVTTASYDSKSVSVTSQASNTQSVNFTSDGETMYVNDYLSNNIYQYTLTTAWDVSTASYASKSFNFAQVAGNSRSVQLYSSNLYVTDNNNSVVYQYSLSRTLALGTGSFASADVGKTIEANSGVFVLTSTAGAYSETTAPTSYAQVASGSWEMYGVVYNTTDGDLELSGVTTGQYTISNLSYSGNSFDTTAQGGNPFGIAFNADGTKMYTSENVNDRINQYSLTTAFDITTATHETFVSVSSQASTPNQVQFNSNGTKMYVLGTGAIYQYTLSTAYDVSTASYDSVSLTVSTQDSTPRGFTFNPEGTRIYMSGQTTARVYQYNLSTAYDLSTGSFASKQVDITQDSLPFGIAVNSSDNKFFVAGSTNDKIYEFDMGGTGDIASSTFVTSVSIATEAVNPHDLTFNNDGTKLFVMDASSNNVFDYDIASTSIPSGYHAVHTTTSTDTTYWTDINSMTADEAAGNGSIFYCVSTDDRTTWKIADNTDGIRSIVRNNSGTWQYNSNGTYASETWTNGTTNTELATLAEAMEGASEVTGYDIANGSYDSKSANTAAQDGSPRECVFKSDGTKMYVIGSTNDSIYQYTLSTAWDVSTASYDSVSFSVASLDGLPFGVSASTDGSKFYIAGNSNDTIYQIDLSTAWDLSTASYNSINFSVASQETILQHVEFKPDGTKMYVVGGINDTVYQYTLSTAWNVSTASYDSVSFSFNSQDSYPVSIAFNADGTKMFMLGTTNDTVYQYSLSTAYNVSTASYDSISLDVGTDVGSGSMDGMRIGDAGTKLYITSDGASPVGVYQFTIGSTTYTNQMDKTQLDAVSDANHFTLGNDLDLAIVFNMTSGTTVPSSDGVSINYDANVLNKGAILGTDYDYDAPAQNKVRITALTGNNLKVRVV